ncbi:MAG TPA: sulfite exporter TauE/SafE family protein [Rhodopila sp.]|uniref:sulfite exporter TauE/SafE family protein n=1 Tax=Rhodopila sp. TaxID=2480087 RepID=UPI002BBA48AC|nr:sulfite exporter TauE/SafE family protein [Rhodopila sp.]HVY14558.1 sulfite exporter TauE/SafE family protein [Rhodopila sp.]
MRPTLLAGIGVAAGIVGGLAGGGGGIVIVPALDHFTSLRRSEIHGTSTLANIAIAVAGVAFYVLRGGSLDLVAGPGMVVGGLVGAPLGARFAKQSSEILLRTIFILVLVVATIDLFFHAAGAVEGRASALFPPAILDHEAVIALIAALIGMVVGAWSAAMGLGGGLLAVPALVLLFGRGQHVAEGTSLALMLPNAISGAIAHVRQGTASVRLGAALGGGALVGSILGVALALYLRASTLQCVFGAFMMLVIVREGIAFRGRIRRGHAKNASSHGAGG